MSRSLKKQPYVETRLYNRVKAMASSGDKKVIKTWSRASTIYPEFIGLTIAVHNGRKHIPVYCTVEMVGFKLGDFAATRNFKAHGGTAKKATKGKKG